MSCMELWSVCLSSSLSMWIIVFLSFVLMFVFETWRQCEFSVSAWGYFGRQSLCCYAVVSRLFLLGATDSGTCELVWTVCVSEHVRAPADSCLCNCCIIRLGVLRCLGRLRCNRGGFLGVRILLDSFRCLFKRFVLECFLCSLELWPVVDMSATGEFLSMSGESVEVCSLSTGRAFVFVLSSGCIRQWPWPSAF